MDNNQTQINGLIETIKEAYNPGSVTNVMVAAVLQFLNTQQQDANKSISDINTATAARRLIFGEPATLSDILAKYNYAQAPTVVLPVMDEKATDFLAGLFLNFGLECYSRGQMLIGQFVTQRSPAPSVGYGDGFRILVREYPADGSIDGTDALWNMIDPSDLVDVRAIEPGGDVYQAEDGELYLDLKVLRELFNIRWNMVWGDYGKYDPTNAPDSRHPYMGNDIWMTYEEAVEVMEVSEYGTLSKDAAAYRFLTASDRIAPRTLLPIALFDANIEWLLGHQRNLEVAAIRYYSSKNAAVSVSDYRYCFEGCVKLKRIYGVLDVTSPKNPQNGIFSMSDIPLEDFKVKTNKSLNFAHFPKLSLESMQFLVVNATNTDSIIITLHAEAYGRLTDELIAQALDKKITFATI